MLRVTFVYVGVGLREAGGTREAGEGGDTGKLVEVVVKENLVEVVV